MDDLLSRVKRVHFIGIGGSGMCPIAEILINKGFSVSGSDLSESDTLARVRTYGIPVYMGQKAENLKDAELVVYSAAVKEDNPERAAARERGIPEVERSVMLGMVTRRYPDSICVSGTHGKTTTTGLITTILLEAGRDPSAIIGGKLPSIGANGRTGKSGTVVCEACEYVDSFLELTPSVSVILNVDADHLDYFKNLENIIKSFRQFAKQTSRTVVFNGDDENSHKAVEGLSNLELITFGLGVENRYSAANIADTKNAKENFDILKDGKKLCNVTLGIPGKHNIYNALAAFAVADHMGVPVDSIAKSLHSFGGVHRRFELLGEFDGVTVADDFAHHPTELTATLEAAMHMGFHEVWAVFQPHTFSRTSMLMDDFATALTIPSHAIVSEILPVREVNTYGVDARQLVAKIPGGLYLQTFPEISDYVVRMARPGDLILTLGGGDVYKCANQIVQLYETSSKTEAAPEA